MLILTRSYLNKLIITDNESPLDPIEIIYMGRPGYHCGPQIQLGIKASMRYHILRDDAICTYRKEKYNANN
jgi:hypothetical protein